MWLKKIRKYLHDISLGYDIKKISKQKGKIGKLDFIKIKNLCVSKGTIKRMKREPTEWEKIFAYHIFYKGLIFRIDKETLTTQQQKEIIQFKNGQRAYIYISPTSPRKDIQHH